MPGDDEDDTQRNHGDGFHELPGGVDGWNRENCIWVRKEKLDIAYSAASVDEMRAQIKEITEICRGTENKHFIWFARLLEDHEEGIVYRAKYKIGTSKLERFNNAIKTERRQG